MSTTRARDISAQWIQTVAAGLLLVIAIGATTAAEDAPTLKWKFTPNEVLRYQMDQKTITEVKSQNQTIKTTVNQVIDTTWKVKAVRSNGVAEMSQTIDRIKTRIESPFGAIDYDSKDDKAPEGPVATSIVPMIKALVGSEFQYKMSPQGELTDVVVPAELVKKLKESGSTGGVGVFTEEGLKNMIHESSLILPSKPLSQPWTRESKIPSPPIGTLNLVKTYSYAGKEKNLDKVALNVTVNLEKGNDANFEIKVGNQEGKGTFFFDNQAGRVVRSTVSEKIEMMIKVMDREATQSSDTATDMKLIEHQDGSR